MGLGGNIVHFKIKRDTQLKKIMEAYCHRQSLQMDQTCFVFDGCRLRGSETPKELEMEDDDFIHVIVVCVYVYVSLSLSVSLSCCLSRTLSHTPLCVHEQTNKQTNKQTHSTQKPQDLARTPSCDNALDWHFITFPGLHTHPIKVSLDCRAGAWGF